MNDTLFQAAQHILVGGVNSPVRAFKSVGGTPIMIQSAKGAYVTDVTGKSYIDYVLSYGPMLLGHADPEVTTVLQKALENGTAYGAPTPYETELAQLIQSFLPSMEKIRFVNSGTEATMSAIRLARGITNRPLLVKFDGGYHGHSDSLLVSAGSGALTFGTPDSAGVLADVAKNTLTIPFNDTDKLTQIFEQFGPQIAAVIVEPICGNMGVILPRDGFLDQLRAHCDQNQSLLIFDEVMTGFRVGLTGAQGDYKVKPDITCLGKVIGGGFPCGAFGGNAKLMDHLAPLGPVYQAGTLSGNPIVMQAGIATLNQLKDGQLFRKACESVTALKQEMEPILQRKGYQFVSAGTMFSLFFTDQTMKDLNSVKSQDINAFNRFFHRSLEYGIYMAPSAFETNFMSVCHHQKELDRTIEAWKKSV